MLKNPPQTSHQSQSSSLWHTPYLASSGGVVVAPPVLWRNSTFRHRRNKGVQVYTASRKTKIKAVIANPGIGQATSTRVKVVVTTKVTGQGLNVESRVNGLLDNITALFGKSIGLELVAADLERSGAMKPTITGYAHLLGRFGSELKYEWEAEIPNDFGEIGAVKVENALRNEMYLKSVDCDGLFNITCNSWVSSKHDSSDKRIFFTNKSYLPSQTPSGLKSLREAELEAARGDGTGTRQFHDRIYDYDVYDDLGDPDDNPEMKRPVLGGPLHPYPRRCRTGRPRCTTDSSLESRKGEFYVPRDEKFSDVKNLSFYGKALDSVIEALLPYLKSAGQDGFSSFTDIDSLFSDGVDLVPGAHEDILTRILRFLSLAEENFLKFEAPEFFEKDKFSWLRDEEFARQTLAGLNPYSIQLVKQEDWPLKSELDPSTYGNPNSAITEKIVEKEIREIGWTMTINEALEQKRLFMLDYHDLLLPYVNKVSEIEGTTLYGSRTLFFLKPDDGTLMPLAIELTRPPADGKPQWKQVYTPSSDATECWLWRLAKVHVLAHDSGYHQLVSHWLRTHCAVEPYIIASNRRLSRMHPVYRLLHRHFRYTMDINAKARQSLINANGIIETSFSPSKYSIELSSVAYDKLWRFDREALPDDLISRGMAVEDPTAPHGLKLAIKDYPFANDGLLLWDAIKQWVTDYVNRYYPKARMVESDTELQDWWTEIRTVGHGDKTDEPWWPELKTPDDLIKVLTTIIWVPSGHHAAVNFGQYLYAAYFPNRPTIARTRMPHDGCSEEALKVFKDKPEHTMLECLPTQAQAVTVIAVIDILSDHSLDEEYIGTQMEAAWEQDPVIKSAFERFNGKLVEIERTINKRNAEFSLKNRCGAGIVPYELLKPFSESGVTGKGVPNSISI